MADPINIVSFGERDLSPEEFVEEENRRKQGIKLIKEVFPSIEKYCKTPYDVKNFTMSIILTEVKNMHLETDEEINEFLDWYITGINKIRDFLKSEGKKDG